MLCRLTFFWLVVALLAGWRITSIVHREEIFAGLREAWFDIREDEKGIVSYPDTFWGELFGCMWCLSVWVGIGVAVVWLLFPYILLPFAVSAGVILLEKIHE